MDSILRSKVLLARGKSGGTPIEMEDGSSSNFLNKLRNKHTDTFRPLEVSMLNKNHHHGRIHI